MFEQYNKHDIAVYGGYIDDNVKLMQSASGGIATALGEYMISLGGYVVGVAYSSDFYKAEYILTNNMSDLDRLKGSKYIECEKNNIFSDVKKLIDNGERVLFFGLPCIVGALYKYLGERPENLLTCELICHGPTEQKVHFDYIRHLEKKYKSKITEFSVRHKKDAWTPAYLYAKFKNGKVFEKPFYDTEYGYAFSVLGRKSCYDCKFKGNNRQADIMIGDFWGASKDDEFWNKYGVSSIFSYTQKGDDFLKSVTGIKLFATTFEKAVEKNPMVITSKKCSENRDKFSNMLSKKGLMYAARHSISVKSKIKKLIPKRLITLIKKFL